MGSPKRIIVNYIRKTKDGEHKAQIMGFPFDSNRSISSNYEQVLGFVKAIHDVVRVCSVVFKY